ncbi:MAG: ABC transporter substrate-binding protein [Nitrospinae bacterium]|nr:ABC transporter substrate-binding protein [Nitrospinota bacterium]
MATLRIGHLSTAYHSALVMMGRRMLEARGITPDWQLFGTGPPIVKGLEEGRLDMGYIGLPPVIIGVARGARIKCVAGGHEEGTVFIARTKYKSAAEAGSLRAALGQFAGKAIGSPTKGSIHDVILRHFLAHEGMEGRIEVRNYPWTDFVGQAMEKGEIEAAVGTPSLQVSLSLVSGLDIKPIVPPHDLWPHNPSYGIIATERLMKERAETLLEFLRAHKAAIAFIKRHPDEAARVSSEVVGVVGAEFFLSAYQVSPRYCAAVTDDYIASTMRFARTMHAHGYIARDVTVAELFDLRFIREVHPEPDHY